MPKVHIPPSLRSLTGDERLLEIDGKSIREVIAAIDRDYPGFHDRVVAEGRLKPGIAVAIGSRISDLGLLETVQPDEEVHFVSSVSGG